MPAQTLLDSSRLFYQKKQEVFSSDLGSEIVLLHPTKGLYFGIKGVGIHLWPLLDQPKSISDMLKHLSQALTTVPQEAEQEIETFLQELINADLIDVMDASSV